MTQELRRAFYDADGALATAGLKAKALAAAVEEAIEVPLRARRAALEELHTDLMQEYRDALNAVIEATEASAKAKQALVEAYKHAEEGTLPRGLVHRRKRVIRVYDKAMFLENAPRKALVVDEKHLNKYYADKPEELVNDGSWGIEVDVSVAVYAERLAEEFAPDWSAHHGDGK